jgi:cyanophycin synthetase
MTNTDGVYVAVKPTAATAAASARNVLMHPDVDAAVFEIRTWRRAARALGFDRCAVAVVTAAATTSVRLNYITTVRTWRCSNAWWCKTWQPVVMQCSMRLTIVATWRRGLFCCGLIVATHRAQRQAGGVVDGGMLVATEDQRSNGLRCGALTRSGSVTQVDNAMAAVAAAWAVVHWEALRSDLASL